MKKKLYTALGLMSGTSMDGVDASLIRSDGFNQFMNIFDEYPDEDELGDFCCGRIYDSNTGISWQGGRWYVKAEYQF